MTRSKTSAGVALWRRIADAIRLDIVGGRLASGDRLPTEAMLADRFAANRHTVRRALAVLAEEGVVMAEQGRGTFVRSIRRLSYPIGRRTRFRDGLKGQAETFVSRIVGQGLDNATTRIAEALAIRPGAKVVRVETLSLADGVPISRSTSWLSYARFPDFAERLGRERSMTEAFRSYGLDDYVRASTRLSARHADIEEGQSLRLAPGGVVLVSEAVDADASGVPIAHVVSRFPAERLELVI